MADVPVIAALCLLSGHVVEPVTKACEARAGRIANFKNRWSCYLRILGVSKTKCVNVRPPLTLVVR